MMLKGIRRIIEFLFPLLICSIYLLRINQDFWGDELYTITHFVLVPLQSTLTDYHVPNNHIFFNLVNNLYLKLIGLQDLERLLMHPWKLRILPFSYALALFYLTYYHLKRLFSWPIALVSLLLIAGSIPYFNFVAQIRGYGLSALLLLVAAFYSIRYAKQGHRRHLIFVGFSSVLCVYSVLSNSYSVFALHAFWIIFFLYFGLIKKHQAQKSKLWAFVLMSIGSALLTFSLYLPVLDDLLSSKYLQISSLFLQWQIEYYLPHLWEGWFSGRWWLFVLIPISIIILIIKRSSKLKSHTQTASLPLALILTLLLLLSAPLISYIRGDHAPLRTFTPLFPFSGILLGILIGSSLEQLPRISFKLIGILCLAILSSYSFYSEYLKIHEPAAVRYANQISRQDLYFQFYNLGYFPKKASRAFSEKIDLDNPLIIYGCQEHGIPHYLDLFDIPYLEEKASLKAFDSLKAKQENFFMVSNKPETIPVDEGDQLIQISDSTSYHTFMKYEHQ